MVKATDLNELCNTLLARNEQLQEKLRYENELKERARKLIHRQGQCLEQGSDPEEMIYHQFQELAVQCREYQKLNDKLLDRITGTPHHNPGTSTPIFTDNSRRWSTGAVYLLVGAVALIMGLSYLTFDYFTALAPLPPPITDSKN